MNSCGTGRGPSRRPSRGTAGRTWGSRACAVGAGRGGRGRSGARRVPGRDLARQRCSCRSHCSRCRREVRCRWLSPSSDCHRRTDGLTRCRAPTGLRRPPSGPPAPRATPLSPSLKAAAWQQLSRFSSFLQDSWLKFPWGYIFLANSSFSKVSC